MTAGADLRFSREGGGGVCGFSKIFEFFFRSFKLLSRELSKAVNSPYFGKNFSAAGKIFEKKNRPKRRFWALFGHFWTKKLRFFGAPPLKISKNWRPRLGAFRKILGSVSQNWISQISSKKGPFESVRGSNSWGGLRWIAVDFTDKFRHVWRRVSPHRAPMDSNQI